MKILYFFYFCGSFLPSWIRIRISNLNADPDPATQINADPCGSGYGSETLYTTVDFETVESQNAVYKLNNFEN
jgi:hypothetical protein